MKVVCQAAQPCRVDLAQTRTVKNLNHVDSTHDTSLTPIHFRVLNDMVDMTNLSFLKPDGCRPRARKIFFQSD
jgi:hypothetical protein